MNRLPAWIFFLIATASVSAAPSPAGSLYRIHDSPYTTFIAQRPGDLLTVIIEESGETQNDGDSESTRENGQDFKLSKVFFPTFNLSKGLDDSNGGGDPAGIAWDSENKFKAKAKNQTKHRMKTRMQVRIVEAVSNGTFVIKGHKTLNIDGKEKKLFVSGVIRQRDIEPDNTIASTKIADANVEIDGEVSQETLEPGFFHKLFNFLF